MHITGMTAMGPQAISGRFETLWHGDGLNAQPDGLKRFYGADQTASIEKRAPNRRSSEDGWDGGYSSTVVINLKTGSWSGAIPISCGNMVILAVLAFTISIYLPGMMAW